MDLRLALNHSLADLRVTLDTDIETSHPFLPSSNISGGSPVPIIFNRRLHVCEWGIPNGPRKPTILLPLSSFPSPELALRPCLVPLDGVYLHDDWSDRVFFVHRSTPGLLFAAAGLSGSGFAILTRQSRPPPDYEVTEFPVLLPPSAFSEWLNDANCPDVLIDLHAHQVLKAPLLAGHTGPDCCEPMSSTLIAEDLERLGKRPGKWLFD